MAFRLGECLLQDRLDNREMTKAEFARRMGVTRQYVGNLLIKDRRKRAVMSLEFATNAAIVLECQMSDFYILERKAKPTK